MSVSPWENGKPTFSEEEERWLNSQAGDSWAFVFTDEEAERMVITRRSWGRVAHHEGLHGDFMCRGCPEVIEHHMQLHVPRPHWWRRLRRRLRR